MVLAGILAAPLAAQRGDRPADRFRPGVTVLLDDQVSLVRNRRIVLIADAVAVDERGRPTAELLRNDPRARAARLTVAGVVSPAAPSLVAAIDSVAAPVTVLVLDLVDDGWRQGPAPAVLVGALRVAAARRVPLVVLDRPNPLTGDHVEGPVPDSLAAASDALYGLPARHGMTVGEMARFFNAAGEIGADVTVVPVRGWRRSWWPGEFGVPPSPGGADRSPERSLLRGALAAVAASNVGVAFGPGRGEASVGAPWLDARRVAGALADRLMPGVKYSESRGRVRIELVSRDQASPWRISAALLATLRAIHQDQWQVDRAALERLTGAAALHDALARGDDSDAVVDRDLAGVVAFARRARAAMLYR